MSLVVEGRHFRRKESTTIAMLTHIRARVTKVGRFEALCSRRRDLCPRRSHAYGLLNSAGNRVGVTAHRRLRLGFNHHTCQLFRA